MRNALINASVTVALKTLREKQPGHLGNVWSVQINESDISDSLELICRAWSLTIVDPANVPDLILDVTMTGISSSFTAAIGVPTLSAVYGQEGDIQDWRDLSADQANYLIQVLARAREREKNLN